MCSLKLRKEINSIYGEKMTMYLYAEISPPPNDSNIGKEKPGSSKSTPSSTCNVCFTTDKSKSGHKLISKRIRRTGKERKYASGDITTLGFML
jgi:hypothetical protein